jgi:predicted SprT family Zn-dependent metalloprotease
MNLKDAKTLALSKMKEHGLSDEWTFKFNNRKSAVGTCSYKKREIQLSKHFVKINDEKIILNTILHEIAHALDTKKSGHGRPWKIIAIGIGCDAKRVNKIAVQPKSKYIAYCPSCGHEHKANRKSRSISACGICCKKYNGNKFSPDFILNFVLNDGSVKKPNPIIVTKETQLTFDQNVFA